jgi:VIT1/CCC1 family predicted Fe2+/Mn2+ transporter
MAGLITGIAASLSMAASEYLSTKAEGEKESPLKASLYTGSTYILTVFFLIFPYLLFGNLYFCLGFTMTNAIIVIFLFTYYVSVAQEIPFARRFFEMAGISLGIATISFFIGYGIRIIFGMEV